VVLKGVFLSVKHAVRAMKKNPGGPAGSSIICTSSAASMAGYRGFPQYGAAKGGINAICPAHGMSANFVLPADAPVLGKSYKEVQGPWIKDNTPIPLKLDRAPNLLDNAYPALFLASDESM